MKIDEFGRPVVTRDEAVTSLLYGNDISYLDVNDVAEIENVEKYCEQFGIKELYLKKLDTTSTSYVDYHRNRSLYWFMEDDYKDMDIEAFLLDKCNSEEQKHRVTMELKMYAERELYPILKLCVYLVDSMRREGIFWGVGRGSSVSSYCLYLIGLHRVDSIKYDLSIKEFLK